MIEIGPNLKGAIEEVAAALALVGVGYIYYKILTS